MHGYVNSNYISQIFVVNIGFSCFFLDQTRLLSIEAFYKIYCSSWGYPFIYLHRTMLKMLQCRHLIPALNAWQPGHNAQTHVQWPPSFLGLDAWITLQLNVALIC